MKLSDWAKKEGISYLTAYRWFKDGGLPVKAYQSDSGTIIVQDDSDVPNLEKQMNTSPSNDVMSLFLKKTVEYSKNNATVEEFAAYVLSNFSLKLNTASDAPKYSKIKPKAEDIQNHFKKFINPITNKPKPNMFIAEDDTLDELVSNSDSLAKDELINEISKKTHSSAAEVLKESEVQDLLKDLSSALHNPTGHVYVKTLDNMGAEGIVTRTVDLTPQLNYTSSIDNNAFGFSLNTTTAAQPAAASSSSSIYNLVLNDSRVSQTPGVTGCFGLTQKEMESASKSLSVDKQKRGRKSHKNTGNK